MPRPRRLPFEEGLLYETELANVAKATVESKALVHVFFAERERARSRVSLRTPRRRAVASGAVVGAGTMGGGIAICFANAGCR